MKRIMLFSLVGLMTCLIGGNEADGRGFGGFRGGGGYSGYSSFSGSRTGFDSFGGSRSSSFEGSRSSSYGGWDRDGRVAGGSSYDRSYTGARGGTVNTSGERGFAAGPRGAVAGGSRDTTVTGAGGRTYSGSRESAAAVGPYSRTVGGAEGSRTVSGTRGTATSNWQSAFAGGGHMSTDFGLGHYSTVNTAAFSHGTVYRSSSMIQSQGVFVRNSFGYYNAFHPAWYSAHPGCWYPARWGAGYAWTAATWASIASWCSVPATPINYDYGNTVVINDNSVDVNGQDVGTPQQYATQATNIADQGQKADPPAEAEWKPLGVFALVQGDATSSNNVFQLAVSKDGIIRGNYYDGIMDTTTQVYGSVDSKSQRAAWTIGKKQDRVFEAGISNLTKENVPVLVHIGKDKTQQWMLVRVQQQSSGN